MAVKESSQFHPDGRTNNWLSLGFKTALNDEEIEAQQKALNQFNLRPIHAQVVQLEALYKQLALLNYQYQSAEARKTPSTFKTWTVQLNLLGSAEDGAVDQILKGDSSRKSVTIIAETEAAIISHSKLQSIQTVAAVGSLVTLPYAIIPIGVRTPIQAKSSLYAVSNNNATASVLTIIEELYSTPLTLSVDYKIAKEEERGVVGKNDWFENFENAVDEF